ncbi:MAG: TolB family protein [Myxococcaceae bacterium]
MLLAKGRRTGVFALALVGTATCVLACLDSKYGRDGACYLDTACNDGGPPVVDGGLPGEDGGVVCTETFTDDLFFGIGDITLPLGGGGEFAPTLSTEAARLCVLRLNDIACAPFELYVQPTYQPQLLSSDAGIAKDPSLTRDGQWLYFALVPTGLPGGHLYRARWDGDSGFVDSQPIPIPGDPLVTGPEISADGGELFFASPDDAGISHLYVVAMGASGQVRGAPSRLSFSSDSANDYSPAISDDGQWLVFDSTRADPSLDAGRGVFGSRRLCGTTWSTPRFLNVIAKEDACTPGPCPLPANASFGPYGSLIFDHSDSADPAKSDLFIAERRFQPDDGLPEPGCTIPSMVPEFFAPSNTPIAGEPNQLDDAPTYSAGTGVLCVSGADTLPTPTIGIYCAVPGNSRVLQTELPHSNGLDASFATHASLNATGDRMYYAVFEPDAGSSLALARASGVTTFGNPVPLPLTPLNFKSTVDGPELSPDGGRLYFSSLGIPGHGADLFWVTLDGQGMPSSLPHPVIAVSFDSQDGGLEFQPAIPSDGRWLFYSRQPVDVSRIWASATDCRGGWLPPTPVQVPVPTTCGTACSGIVRVDFGPNDGLLYDLSTSGALADYDIYFAPRDAGD